MNPQSVDNIYTTDEAAARLRLTRRALIKIARRSGHCSRVGRDYLFSEADLLAIWQDMREPAQEPQPRTFTAPMRSPSGTLEDLKWMADSPPTSVDRRVLGVLRWLDKQKEPKTYAQIDRCGPRTVNLLLAKSMVSNCGVDDDGLVRVSITTAGRDQLKIVERWKRKREARKKRGG